MKLCSDYKTCQTKGDFTVKKGETRHIAILHGDAVGVHYTGKKLCFSHTYYEEKDSGFGNPSKDYTCEVSCKNIDSFTEYVGLHSTISRPTYYSQQYIKIDLERELGEDTDGGNTSSSMKAITNISLILLSLLILVI